MTVYMYMCMRACTHRYITHIHICMCVCMCVYTRARAKTKTGRVKKKVEGKRN